MNNLLIIFVVEIVLLFLICFLGFNIFFFELFPFLSCIIYKSEKICFRFMMIAANIL